MDQLQREHIENVLRLTGGRVSGEKGAAALLAMPRSTLVHRMRKLGLTRG
jgi:transcriptional regulator with GAF, ATPase, and Fis domain